MTLARLWLVSLLIFSFFLFAAGTLILQSVNHMTAELTHLERYADTHLYENKVNLRFTPIPCSVAFQSRKKMRTTLVEPMMLDRAMADRPHGDWVVIGSGAEISYSHRLKPWMSVHSTLNFNPKLSRSIITVSDKIFLEIPTSVCQAMPSIGQVGDRVLQ